MGDRLSELLNFRKGELPLALLSALFYFCVLCGYFFLRPVRDAMGVSRGMDQLRWLFVLTSMASLVFVLLFGGVVSRMDRRRFIPVAYGFVTVSSNVAYVFSAVCTRYASGSPSGRSVPPPASAFSA
ncbi:MAG: hypothetical protein P8170_11130, partial [Gemmatimonadota bacterium]